MLGNFITTWCDTHKKKLHSKVAHPNLNKNIGMNVGKFLPSPGQKYEYCNCVLRTSRLNRGYKICCQISAAFRYVWFFIGGSRGGGRGARGLPQKIVEILKRCSLSQLRHKYISALPSSFLGIFGISLFPFPPPYFKRAAGGRKGHTPSPFGSVYALLN